MSTTTKQADAETLSMAQRYLELLAVVALLMLFGFFAYHQVANTGFFTAKFRIVEMVCLYGPIIFAIVAPIVRAGTGRRNPARLLEAASSLFLAITAVWFLMVFPFNFSHLADPLPSTIRFVCSWVTDDLGKILLILQVIIGPISALMTIWQYLSMRSRESVILPPLRPL